jgi:hypothetical protein
MVAACPQTLPKASAFGKERAISVANNSDMHVNDAALDEPPMSTRA